MFELCRQMFFSIHLDMCGCGTIKFGLRAAVGCARDSLQCVCNSLGLRKTNTGYCTCYIGRIWHKFEITKPPNKLPQFQNCSRYGENCGKGEWFVWHIKYVHHYWGQVYHFCCEQFNRGAHIACTQTYRNKISFFVWDICSTVHLDFFGRF